MVVVVPARNDDPAADAGGLGHHVK